MNKIKRIGEVIRNNIILISASLALAVSIAMLVYINELPPIIEVLAMETFFVSFYIVISELMAEFTLKRKPSGAI